LNLKHAYYSLPDKALVKQVPQPLQHLAIAEMAAKRGGEIVHYTMEDPYTLATQEIFLSKVNEKPRVKGFIFFTLDQFSYSGELNLKLLENVLAQGYELNFAREKFTLASAQDLDREFPLLYTRAYVGRRDADHGLLRAVLG